MGDGGEEAWRLASKFVSTLSRSTPREVHAGVLESTINRPHFWRVMTTGEPRNSVRTSRWFMTTIMMHRTVVQVANVMTDIVMGEENDE